MMTACGSNCESACQFACQDSCEVTCEVGCESDAEHEAVQVARRPKNVPEGLLRAVLLRVETMLVVTFGRKQPGISLYQFVVRPEHGSPMVPDCVPGKQQRRVNRKYVPINFSVRFEGQSAVIPWHDAYPDPLEKLGKPGNRVTVVNYMASAIVAESEKQLKPGYAPF